MGPRRTYHTLFRNNIFFQKQNTGVAPTYRELLIRPPPPLSTAERTGSPVLHTLSSYVAGSGFMKITFSELKVKLQSVWRNIL
jgi:hypothetical protein